MEYAPTVACIYNLPCSPKLPSFPQVHQTVPILFQFRNECILLCLSCILAFSYMISTEASYLAFPDIKERVHHYPTLTWWPKSTQCHIQILLIYCRETSSSTQAKLRSCCFEHLCKCACRLRETNGIFVFLFWYNMTLEKKTKTKGNTRLFNNPQVIKHFLLYTTMEKSCKISNTDESNQLQECSNPPGFFLNFFWPHNTFYRASSTNSTSYNAAYNKTKRKIQEVFKVTHL